jgi:hypothetical protein
MTFCERLAIGPHTAILSRVLGCKMVESCKTRSLRDRKTLSLDLSLVQYTIYLKLKYLRKMGEDQTLLPCDFKNIVQCCANSEEKWSRLNPELHATAQKLQNMI